MTMIAILQWNGAKKGLCRLHRECTYPGLPKMPTLELQGTEEFVDSLIVIKDVSPVFQHKQLYSSMPGQICYVYPARKCSYHGDNSQLRHYSELAHAMPWRTLKKMMTDKYCPRGEIKKLDFRNVNLKMSYDLPQNSMDKKINTWAERQADNKRKSDDTARNNQKPAPNKETKQLKTYPKEIG
ncbi:hypothetical protein Tco_1227865 [Tanacetum coccineum]